MYARVVMFDGPRSPELVAAADRAGRERIMPTLSAEHSPPSPNPGRRTIWRRHHMNRFLVFAFAATLAATSGSGVAAAESPSTPNSCIAVNGGDWNACNVGNSGRGDLPYRAVTYTPSSCIAANGGDWNACNFDNSGRGDLPYWHSAN